MDFNFHVKFFNNSQFSFVIPWRFNKTIHVFDTLLRCIYVALNWQVLSFQSKRFDRQANREYLSSAMIYSTFTEWQRVTFVCTRHACNVCVFKHVTGITMSPDTRYTTDFTNAVYTLYTNFTNLLIHIFRLKYFLFIYFYVNKFFEHII